MAIIGAVFSLFMVVCFALTWMAVRSIWQVRYEKPLTPVRLLLILTTVGTGLLAVGLTTNEPSIFVLLVSAVGFVSLAWLVLYERFRK